MQRLDIVREARSWLGTPYHHQASLKGVGVDCVGLVRGIWRELTGYDPVPNPPAYSSDWHSVADRDSIIDLGKEKMLVISRDAEPSVGDVVALAMLRRSAATHVGVLTADGTMIHAAQGSGVSEVEFRGHFASKVRLAFTFPFVDE